MPHIVNPSTLRSWGKKSRLHNICSLTLYQPCRFILCGFATLSSSASSLSRSIIDGSLATPERYVHRAISRNKRLVLTRIT